MEENQKLFSKAREVSKENISLLTVKDPKTNTLNIVMTDGYRVSKIKIKMDQINMPDKLHFHKQSIEIFYSDLIQTTLSKKKKNKGGEA